MFGLEQSGTVAPVEARTVRDHVGVARLALMQGDYHAALRNLNCALCHLEGCKEKFNDSELAQIERLAGKIYIELRMYKDAERALQNAISLHAGYPGSESLSDTRHLADCFRLSHRLEESEALYKQCIAASRGVRGAELQLGKSNMGLGQVSIDANKLDQADRAVNSALKIFELNGGSKGYWYGRCLLTQARLRFSQGKLQESEGLLHQSLQILEPQIGPRHPLRARALRGLGIITEREGNNEQCQELLAEARKIEDFLKAHDR